ncbi:MAG: Ig-like domain-containing protein, partial [Lachnospiraceae bacterium]|nr:Ig-like domain-containing protein [Lachnospiraceae bacterium]
KPEKVTIHVGDTYTIPDEVMIETLGNLRYSNASKVAVSDDGKITALSKGTVKVKYTQSGKSKIVLKLKITK